VVCVVEDLHWSDPSTLEVLDQLVRRIPSWPLLLLVTARPEFVSPWTGLAHDTLLALRRLSPSATAELMTRVAGGSACRRSWRGGSSARRTASRSSSKS